LYAVRDEAFDFVMYRYRPELLSDPVANAFRVAFRMVGGRSPREHRRAPETGLYYEKPVVQGGESMSIASDLLTQHLQTLVDDNARWQELLADDVLWELAYAPSLGHPAKLAGKAEAVRHAAWFAGAVENFRFSNLKVYAFDDPQGAAAEVRGEGLIKSTGRVYQQDYAIFLRSVDGKISFLREYFDPVRAAKALDVPILGS
jgi:uncharacterized protein